MGEMDDTSVAGLDDTLAQMGHRFEIHLAQIAAELECISGAITKVTSFDDVPNTAAATLPSRTHPDECCDASSHPEPLVNSLSQSQAKRSSSQRKLVQNLCAHRWQRGCDTTM